MGYRRNFHSMCYLTPTKLVVSGSRETKNGSDKAIELYDLTKDKWITLPAMDKGRSRHSSIGFQGKYVYVFCGLVDMNDKVHYAHPVMSRNISYLDCSNNRGKWIALNVFDNMEARTVPGVL